MSDTQAFACSPSSPPCFNGYERHSLYVPGFDGTLLALDYFLPTRDGIHASEPLPVIFQMTPYNRAQLVANTVQHILSPYCANGQTYRNNLHELCLRGYVLAAVDVRGQGASFGTYPGVMTIEEGCDGAAVIAWLRAQPWCNGRVGMLGSSYGAATQLLVAAERPPGLAALYLCHIYFDAYDAHFPGGIRELQIPSRWGKLVDDLAGRTAESIVAPVDGPEGAALREAAVAAHRLGAKAGELFARALTSRFRDENPFFERASHRGPQNLCTLLPRLEQARIPAYHHGGWNDFYPDQTAKWFTNWSFAPRKLVIGPWSHSPRCFFAPRDEEDLRIRTSESLRWFDYWLKDEPTGVLEEPAVHYAIQTSHPYGSRPALDHWEWRSSGAWPIEGTRPQRWFFTRGHSGGAPALGSTPSAVGFEHTITIEPVSTGIRNRMGGAFCGEPVQLPEMSSIDARSLSFTSEQLEEDIVLAGVVELDLSIASDAPDVALFTWLEDVDPEGRSTLVTHGCLRASHRSQGTAPYDSAGMRWHRGSRAAVESTTPLTQGVTRLSMSLQPVANRFLRGHRLRLTIAGADHGNYEDIALGAKLTMISGTEASSVYFPVRTGTADAARRGEADREGVSSPR